MTRTVNVNILNIVWGKVENEVVLPSEVNNVELTVEYKTEEEFDSAVEYQINEYLVNTYKESVQEFDWKLIHEEDK